MVEVCQKRGYGIDDSQLPTFCLHIIQTTPFELTIIPVYLQRLHHSSYDLVVAVTLPAFILSEWT